MNQNLSDAALVVVGHGSTVNEESSAPARQHADELRRRKVFAEVHAAFWKEEPFIPDVVSAIRVPRIFVVPLFVSEGYFTQQAIPRALGFAETAGTEFPRVLQREGQTLIYCGPVGTHDSMTDVLLARARDVVERFPFPRPPKPQDIALFIVGHGTEQNENSRRAIERQVERIRAMNLYAAVHAAFLEEDPRIADVYAVAQTRNIIVVPFFISDGMHTNEDIPVLLGEPRRAVKARLEAGQPTWRNPTEKQDKRLWYTPAIGSEPHIADVILERVREALKQS